MAAIFHNENEFPSESGLTSWAWDATNNQDWIEASRRWSFIRKLYPDNESSWVQGGVAEKNNKNIEEANTLLATACDKFPNNPNPWIALANMKLELEGLELANETLQEIQTRFPNLPFPYIKRAHYLAIAGSFIEAEKVNSYTREIFAEYENPYIQYCELAEMQGNWTLALQRWMEFRNKFPKHPAGYNRTATVAEKCGDSRLARKLKSALKLGLNNKDLSFNSSEQISNEKDRSSKSKSWMHLWELIWTKSQLNLKSEAKQNYLRHVWWVLDPLLYMAVFYIVFAVMLERGGEGYLGYLLTGLIPFQWFAKTIQLSSNSILSGRGLMNQVKIPAIFFPLVVVTQTTGKQMIIFAMLVLFLLFYGIEPGIHWFALIPIMFVQCVLIILIACIVAMVIPFVRDLTNLVPTGVQFVMFASGIFYSVDHLSDELKSYFYMNPVALLLREYRTVLLGGNWPDWISLFWLASVSAIALGILVIVYKKLSSLYPRVVIE